MKFGLLQVFDKRLVERQRTETLLDAVNAGGDLLCLNERVAAELRRPRGSALTLVGARLASGVLFRPNLPQHLTEYSLFVKNYAPKGGIKPHSHASTEK